MANSFGEYLQAARNAAGFKLREFAKLVGIAPSYLSDIENDRRVPSEDVLRKLARELKLDMTELLGRAGRMGDVVERYVQSQPVAGVLFRKIADGRLDDQQIQKLMKQTEAMAAGKKKGEGE